jgi:hypothetical protein
MCHNIYIDVLNMAAKTAKEVIRMDEKEVKWTRP